MLLLNPFVLLLTAQVSNNLNFETKNFLEPLSFSAWLFWFLEKDEQKLDTKGYVDREIFVLNSWINNTPYLNGAKGTKNNISDISAVDAKLILPNKKEYLVEIKVEDDLPFKTGNLGFDLISAFTWKNKPNYGWTPIHLFLEQVNIQKWGSFLDVSYDILLKGLYQNRKLQNIIAMWGAKLRTAEIWNYVKYNLNCKANNKKQYGLNDDWESAFFVLPIKSTIVQNAIIKETDFQ